MVEFKRILVPLDGSSLSENALPIASTLAQQFRSQFILLQVFEVSKFLMPTVVTYPDAQQLLRQLSDEVRLQIERYLREKQDELAQQGLEVRTLVGEGAPAEVIVETAFREAINLIIMSTHGRGGLARWSQGSVADKVARHAPCPVLLVRQNQTILESGS